MVEYALWDGDCLYEYAVIEDQNDPALVVRDLSGTPEKGSHKTYWQVKHNVDQVLAEIGHTLQQELDGMAAVCRDVDGIYCGIDLLGQYHRAYPLSQTNAITDEAEALPIARELHIMRKQQLARIMACLPMGKVVQYSQVILSCYGGGGTSFYMSGCPDNSEIIRHPEYIRLLARNPYTKTCYMEVTSYKVSRAAAPISYDLLNEINTYGFDAFRNQSIVEPGEARSQNLYVGYTL